MFYTTKALILRESQYKDNDKILSLLTEDLGLVTVKARGVKRKNSPLKSGCQLLCYSEVTVFEKNGFYTVNEADPIHMFMNLRTDIELLSLGSYFAQLLEYAAAQDQVDPELLALGLNSLYALDKLARPQVLVKAAFELRLLSLIGYLPNLEGCAACDDPCAKRFYFSDGVLLCDTCRKLSGMGDSRVLSDGVLAAMNHIVRCPRQKLFSFSLPEQALKELSDIAERFLLAQLDTNLPALQFYKRLFITI